MRDNNFYTIHGWMINRLKLSGNELILYAVIYGFSQAEDCDFRGSLNYLKDCINASVPTVIKAINSLKEKGFIDKEEVEIKKVKRCIYRVTKISLEGTKESLEGDTKEPLNNNKDIDNNKENKKDKNKFLSKKVEEQPLFDEVVDEKEKNYLEHMHEHYPFIMKMDKPLTYDEFKTLRENYDVDLVWDKMDNLENTKNMRKKYVSAYLTINNWCKMSFNREPKKKEDEQ